MIKTLKVYKKNIPKEVSFSFSLPIKVSIWSKLDSLSTIFYIVKQVNGYKIFNLLSII